MFLRKKNFNITNTQIIKGKKLQWKMLPFFHAFSVEDICRLLTKEIKEKKKATKIDASSD
jgi:hypothetical protein